MVHFLSFNVPNSLFTQSALYATCSGPPLFVCMYRRNESTSSVEGVIKSALRNLAISAIFPNLKLESSNCTNEVPSRPETGPKDLLLTILVAARDRADNFSYVSRTIFSSGLTAFVASVFGAPVKLFCWPRIVVTELRVKAHDKN